MLEKQVEKYLCDKVKEIGGLCEKFTSPGRRAVPDRLITLPENNISFVELKAPGRKATAAQERDHEKRRALGVKVYVLNSIKQVDDWIEDVTRIY
jgi:hypothetical protein